MTDMKARTSVGRGLGIERLERLGRECIVDNKTTGIKARMCVGRDLDTGQRCRSNLYYRTNKTSAYLKF